jgi:hypothetical protein
MFPPGQTPGKTSPTPATGGDRTKEIEDAIRRARAFDAEYAALVHKWKMDRVAVLGAVMTPGKTVEVGVIGYESVPISRKDDSPVSNR